MGDALPVVGLVMIAATLTYFAVGKKRLDQLLSIFHGPRRRISSASTPPPSVMPKKPSSTPSYSTSLPPLRREALHEVANADWGKVQKESLLDKDTSEEQIRQALLPMTADYKTCEGVKFTPTGISTEEVKALGDFPDYATLSGVPLPEAYTEFDINKALPRPYRPFRWSYHQTMCT